MITPSAAAGLIALVLLRVLFKRFTRPSLSMIRGPKSPSFFLGRVLSPSSQLNTSLSLLRQFAGASPTSSWRSGLCMAESVWQRCSLQECLRSESTHSIISCQRHPQQTAGRSAPGHRPESFADDIGHIGIQLFAAAQFSCHRANDKWEGDFLS